MAAERAQGTVKWFNGSKGFGFISPDDGSQDLFVHHSSVKADGFPNLKDGEAVEFTVGADSDGRAKAIDVSAPGGGALAGRVAQVLRQDADPAARCTECTDDRKDKPIVGLDIIRGGQKAADKAVWEGGKILDPENGKEYRASFTPIDGGARMEVRGYLGPFWRTQTWTRSN